MREVIVGGRSIAVTHIKTEPTEYGDIQRYRVDVSGERTSFITRRSGRPLMRNTRRTASGDRASAPSP